MSTRGWYEYHVIDPATCTHSLSMQFYKWGDATPENALLEWKMLKGHIDRSKGLLPVIWLDDLLREQLGPLYSSLPRHFSLTAFLFLIQRASEECAPYHDWACRELPRDQRPDYRLGFAVGEAMALNGFEPRGHTDPHLNRVLSFIATGHYVRPWKDYALSWSVVQWLQYLTQVTLERGMGSIAGDLRMPYGDVSYIHRFFIWTDPSVPFGIDRLALQLCDRDGDDLLEPLGDADDEQGGSRSDELEEAAKTQRQAEELHADLYSLRTDEVEFTSVQERLWCRACHEQPPVLHGQDTPIDRSAASRMRRKSDNKR